MFFDQSSAAAILPENSDLLKDRLSCFIPPGLRKLDRIDLLTHIISRTIHRYPEVLILLREYGQKKQEDNFTTQISFHKKYLKFYEVRLK
jgi:hypothetical protein